MRLIRFSWLIVVALLFWAAQDEASAQAKKSVPSKQAVPQGKAPAAKSAVKSGTKAVAKAPVRNQYKRSTSIRRTYGTGKAPASRRVAMKSKAPAPRRVFYSPGQQSPSTDRYVEIERALVDRGYLQKEPDGKWDQKSAEALKQFQTEHNLRADGKLSSMALIALGLGPKRIPAGAVTPANPQAPKPAAPAPVPPPAAAEPPAANEASQSPR